MSTTRKVPAFWRRRSLRFWLATGMLMSLVPIFASAVTGYFLYHQAISQPLVEVSSNQRSILQPLQDMQMALWDVSESVNSFAINGQPRGRVSYQQEAQRIDRGFANLVTAVKEQGLEMSHVNKALDEWRRLSTLSSTILSSESLQGNAVASDKIEEFETLINRLAHQFGTIQDTLRVTDEKTHAQALSSLMLSDRLAVAGLVLSITGAILGIVLINRSFVSGMDRLATGATRFAAGDREHRVKVLIPCELASVADAFNLMTKRIHEQEEVLERMATTDGLTGLYNRRAFDSMLAEEIRRAERYRKSVSLILCDIDHFKNFNDTYGHQAGDEALRTVAQTLTENLRDVDKKCRYGGEELVVILPECDAKAALRLAERVRAAVNAAELHVDEDQTANLTVSLGVATFPDNGKTPETLLKSADLALYQSKKDGRNRVMTAV